MCDYPGVAQPSQWEVLVGNLDGVGVQARSWFGDWKKGVRESSMCLRALE